MHRLIAALDSRTTPLSLFFRDDDAGWGMDALDAMLSIFAQHACPVDLAVIPAALDTRCADRLNGWRRRHAGIGFHQHGYAHLNHEPSGIRKCEFGQSRPLDRQCADILMGRERLTSMLESVDPIFTPPWNRCIPETVCRLTRMGFQTYSADRGISHGSDMLTMLPVSLDWERALRESALIQSWALLLEEASAWAGVMLHHAVMNTRGLVLLDRLLSVISDHPNVSVVSMRTLAGRVE